MKGRSCNFSPFDMQLMIDDSDLMQDDAQMIVRSKMLMVVYISGHPIYFWCKIVQIIPKKLFSDVYWFQT